MYKIKNISLGKVAIKDLHLMLERDQIIDLDERHSREAIKFSTYLMQAKNEKKIVELEVNPPLFTEPTVMMEMSNPEDDSGLEDKILDILSKFTQNQPQPTPVAAPTPPPSANPAVDELAKKMDLLLNSMSQMAINSGVKKQLEEDYVDEEDLKKIFKKNVKNLTKNAETNISLKSENKQFNGNSDAIADELGDII